MQEAFSRNRVVRKPAVHSQAGIVAAQNRKASEVGARVLAEGGNAVDAAVATGLAVGVLEPWMSGIGGGGVMLIHLAREDRVTAFDFGMRAPAGLDPADYPLSGGADTDLFGWPAVVEGRNLHGGLSIAVPGHVDGLALALERYGTWSWSRVLEPAIALAEAGLSLDWFMLLQIAQHAGDLDRYAASREIYLDDGHPPGPLNPPRRLPTPALAATLRRLADAGPRDFYEGELARSMVADLQAAGGRHTAEDFARYRAREVAPTTLDHRGCRISVLPELNGGPTLLRALTSIGRAWPGGGRPDSAFFLACADALQEAFAHRLSELGDEQPGSDQPSCTTHLSTVDRDGNMVALTQTLLSVFGSKVTLPDSGVLMNNGINWFDPRPGRPNSLGPGKRPLSNYVPVIGRKGVRRFAIGGSGGRRIIPAMTQLALMLGDCGLSLDEAIHHPRIDVTGGDTITLDPGLGEAVSALRTRHSVTVLRPDVAPNLYAIPSVVLRDGEHNWGAVEPHHPWAEAVVEEEVAGDGQ